MNYQTKNILTAFLLATLVGFIAFIFSFFELFNLAYISLFLIFCLAIATILFKTLLIILFNADKTKSLQEAACSSGKLTLIGANGTILCALFTLLLVYGKVNVLANLALSFTFFFLTLTLASCISFINIYWHFYKKC